MAYFDLTTILSQAQAITTTADSTNVFDITGAGVGNAPAMIGAGGINTAIGVDFGSGDGMAMPQVFIAVTTAGTGAGTISFSLKAAPDSGTYTEGTYTTLYTSNAFVGTTFLVGNVYSFNIPPIVPAEKLPRFYKLTYTVSGSATASFTADILLNAPSLRIATLYGNNYISI